MANLFSGHDALGLKSYNLGHGAYNLGFVS